VRRAVILRPIGADEHNANGREINAGESLVGNGVPGLESGGVDYDGATQKEGEVELVQSGQIIANVKW
jgi:hypothetical protein